MEAAGHQLLRRRRISREEEEEGFGSGGSHKRLASSVNEIRQESAAAGSEDGAAPRQQTRRVSRIEDLVDALPRVAEEDECVGRHSHMKSELRDTLALVLIGLYGRSSAFFFQCWVHLFSSHSSLFRLWGI